MATSDETIATLLHKYLVRTGLTDGEFASLLGVDQAQISRWRRGVGVPRQSWNEPLAEVLELPAAEIEEARCEGEKVRADVAALRTVDTKEELKKTRAELRAARAKIARLEAKLGQTDGS